MNGKMERIVWIAKNYFLIIGVAAWLLIPFSVDLFLLLHRYSFLIPFAIWLCKKKQEVAGRSSVAAAAVPQDAPAPMASSVANLLDFLFFKPQEEEQRLRGFEDVDEPSAASQGTAWWLNEPVLDPAGAVGKEPAEKFSWDGVVDSTAWKHVAVAPSAPPISTAYSTSFFPFDDDCKEEGGCKHNKSMEETWEAICLMEEKRRRRRRVKDAGGRRKREVPAVKMDELFRDMDALIEKQRHRFEFDFRREESPVRWPRRAAELDRPPAAPLGVTQTRRAAELDRPPAAPLAVTQTRRAAELDRRQ